MPAFASALATRPPGQAGSASRAGGTWTDALLGDDALGALLVELSGVEAADEPGEIDLITRVESVKSALAAVQARAAVRLDERRRAAEAARGVPAHERGKGVAEEVALARRDSPTKGSQHLGFAKALLRELPRTMTLLEQGDVSEWRATLVARETAMLDAEDRRVVDEAVATDLPRLSDAQAAARARHHARQLDQASAVERLERHRRERRVSVRPAPGGMAYVTALLTLTDAVAVKASLLRAADTEVTEGGAVARTRDQVAADLFVERITGTRPGRPGGVDLTLVMTDETLLGGDEPARIPGEGPLDAAVARGILTADQAGDVQLRRLWVEPETGRITKMDVRSRLFSKRLRALVLARDDRCRNLWCGAPIRQVDHVRPHAAGGTTDVANASGLCQRCNLAKENEGWSHSVDGEDLTVSTPTGHRYSTRGGSALAQTFRASRTDAMRRRYAESRAALAELEQPVRRSDGVERSRPPGVGTSGDPPGWIATAGGDPPEMVEPDDRDYLDDLDDLSYVDDLEEFDVPDMYDLPYRGGWSG
ncbi:HNH endonuclease [Georgenia sp. Z1344]|uniref:HNH endonuclease n=1 Tax=Georgenia sp. Z1344 TaxID=3416706 RepID=UPI003CE888B3